jgi:hypothetical protein
VGLKDEGRRSERRVDEDFAAVFADEGGDEGFEEDVHVEEEIEGIESAGGELGCVVGEEEAGELEERLEAATEAGNEASRVGIGAGEVTNEGDGIERVAKFGEEGAVFVGAGEEEEAFDDETEDTIEGVVDGELVVGAGEEVLAVGAAELVGDAKFAAEEGEVVMERLVGAMGGGVDLTAEVVSEETGKEFEPVVGLIFERRGMMFEKREVEGIGEEDEEVAGGFGLAVLFVY